MFFYHQRPLRAAIPTESTYTQGRIQKSRRVRVPKHDNRVRQVYSREYQRRSCYSREADVRQSTICAWDLSISPNNTTCYMMGAERKTPARPAGRRWP